MPSTNFGANILKTLAVMFCCLMVMMNGHAQTPPTLAAIPDQTAVEDVPIVPLYMNVSDAQTAVTNLQFSAVSSNTNAFPNENVVFHYFEYNANGFLAGWYLTATPRFGVTNGSSTITATVNDGVYTTNTSFLLTVVPPTSGSARFANTSPISILDGTASPYQSTINVSGMGGAITNLTLVLSGFSHQNVRDVNALLVAPGGQAEIVMSHVSGYYPATNLAIAVTGKPIYYLPLAQNYPLWSEMPLLPVAYGSIIFPAPAPTNSYGSSFSDFNGSNPNGTWSLYVYDDGFFNTGKIAGGWSLTITTSTNGITDALQLETQPDGFGSAVSAQNIASGNSNTVFAIQRDGFGNFITNVAASWLLTNITGGVSGSDLHVAADSKSATFTGNSPGSADINVTFNDNGALLSADSGTFTVVSATLPILLANGTVLASGAFQFTFTNIPSGSFMALAATNLSLPLSNWNVLGSIPEISPGVFQFNDPQATNDPQRFYRVRSP